MVLRFSQFVSLLGALRGTSKNGERSKLVRTFFEHRDIRASHEIRDKALHLFILGGHDRTNVSDRRLCRLLSRSFPNAHEELDYAHHASDAASSLATVAFRNRPSTKSVRNLPLADAHKALVDVQNASGDVPAGAAVAQLVARAPDRETLEAYFRVLLGSRRMGVSSRTLQAVVDGMDADETSTPGAACSKAVRKSRAASITSAADPASGSTPTATASASQRAVARALGRSETSWGSAFVPPQLAAASSDFMDVLKAVTAERGRGARRSASPTNPSTASAVDDGPNGVRAAATAAALSMEECAQKYATMCLAGDAKRAAEVVAVAEAVANAATDAAAPVLPASSDGKKKPKGKASSEAAEAMQSDAADAVAGSTGAFTAATTGLPHGRLVCEPKYDGERMQLHVALGDRPASIPASGKAGDESWAIWAFSRSGRQARKDRWTESVPALLAIRAALRKAGVLDGTLVLDAEVVPVDPHGNLMPFSMLGCVKRASLNETSKASRGKAAPAASDSASRPCAKAEAGNSTTDAEKPDAEKPAAVRLALFVFDVLQIGHIRVQDAPLALRRGVLFAILSLTYGRDRSVRAALRASGTPTLRAASVLPDSPELRVGIPSASPGGVRPTQDSLVVAVPQYSVANADEVIRLYVALMALGSEGLMVKDSFGSYQPGVRRGWAKVKPDCVGGDTADLAILGAWPGRGRRGHMLSSFLLGTTAPASPPAKPPAKGRRASATSVNTRWLTVCRSSGLPDDMLAELTEFFLADPPRMVTESEAPDWVEDPSTSQRPPMWLRRPPTSRNTKVVEVNAMGASFSTSHSSGVSLRFPRIIRMREDKDVQDTTSVEELVRQAKQMSESTSQQWSPTTRPPRGVTTADSADYAPAT
eukprot:TRINITY_DN871_c0_g1_i1.p1 TRINITY_DN871_c0_g1~~TRINITY_DN871_c0_g1_i1.p1  ORF type:complete len:879 (+),score=151.22 TRINITY_DN871_c0_g1_i1:94-2730(+)